MSEPVETCLIAATRMIDGRLHVLVGEKLRGFGQGRVVVPGGKVEAGETPRDAAARELLEETSLHVDASRLSHRGIITFRFPDGGGADMRVSVFVTETTRGEVADSDELAVFFAPVDALPAERMWPDNALWLPCALMGDIGAVTFTYDPDGATLVGHTFG